MPQGVPRVTRQHRSTESPAATSRARVDSARSHRAFRARSDAIGTDSRTAFAGIQVDQGAAGRKRLQAATADLLAAAGDPDTFEQRLFALARDAVVLNEARLVRCVHACLPQHARTARAAARRVLRRLHLSAAFECDGAGYSEAALRHLLRHLLLQPASLFRRRAVGILYRYFRGSDAQNRRLLRQAASVFRLLNERGIRARIFGSLAISLHAGRFVKHHGDIDLVFPSEADTNRAATLLVDELGCRVVRRQDWSGLTGERCFHIALDAPGGVRMELSYLPENPGTKERVVVVDGARLRIADLRGLRRVYALFLVRKAAMSHDVEKQSKKNAILTIDRLLSAQRSGHRHAVRLRPSEPRQLRRA